MKRRWLTQWLVLMLLMIAAGAAWMQSAAQDVTPSDFFSPIRQIGQPRPSGIRYEPIYDRFVWVDLDGRLVLVDAQTYQVQHVLYESGAYNAYRFSHDGNYLAIALDRRIELWDANTGQEVAEFEPPANLVQGPLHFTPDDRYLLFDSVVPAPQETRRSENDTSIIPYLWDLASARDEATSRFPTGEDFYPFFNFRNGLVVGANTFLIAGIPRRLQVIDGGQRDFPVIAELESGRLERDPITVWQSATDDWLYADPGNGSINQIDTQSGTITPLNLGFDVNATNIESYDRLRLANNARVLCEPRMERETPLLQLIFGDGYLSYQNYDPLTVMLFDVLTPMTMSQDRGALLIYTFNERAGRGNIELIRPQAITQMTLSPDRTRLLVSRYGTLELYNLESCLLERTIYPAEPDFNGTNILAFNAAGDTIIYDFQRFETNTGELLAHQIDYTSGFADFTFSTDSQRLFTNRGDTTWSEWEIATGRVVGGFDTLQQGEILASEPDNPRFLVRENDENVTILAIVDARAGTRRELRIPDEPNRSIQTLIPSADWENALLRYSDGGIAVYGFNAGLRLQVGRDDLPASTSSLGWIDARTIYALGNGLPPNNDPRIAAPPVEYDASGLPACLVRAYPDQWESWRLLWEAFTLNLDSYSLNRLAARLCAALPPDASGFIPALTPTAPFRYSSDATPIPFTIPGVPACLTSRFQREATDYAALWREISADLPPEQQAELAVMICEGLITSVSGVQPTATINPNLNVPPTPTPIDAAPQSLESSENNNLSVIAIDIQTGQRSIGSYLPPQEGDEPPLNLQTLNDRFFNQYNRRPNNPVLSPDGHLMAEFTPDGNNFITIYRLARPYGDIIREQIDATATRAAAQRGIGLQPTATDSFTFIGEINATLTPTITPTSPPLTQNIASDWTPDRAVDLCPARQLFTTAALPPDFAVSGRIFAAPPMSPDGVWVFEPENGRVYVDDNLPRCGFDEECVYSHERTWIARYSDGLVVSRPDGGQPTVLYPPDATIFEPYNLVWLPGNRLRYNIDGYQSGLQGRRTFIRTYDADTGEHTDPVLPLPAIQHPILEDAENPIYLPTDTITVQPGGTLALVSTPANDGGAKLYIYDRATDTFDYFARTNGDYEAFWHPFGDWLDYRLGQDWYRFDPATRTHARLPDFNRALSLDGTRSPDARYRAAFVDTPTNVSSQRYFADAYDALEEGSLPYKLIVIEPRTGMQRRYCIPNTGFREFAETRLIWSYDSRYLAFIAALPIEGDNFDYLTPQPTLPPYTPAPTETPIALQTLYEYQQPVLFVLDTETGAIVIYETPLRDLIFWTTDGGAS